MGEEENESKGQAGLPSTKLPSLPGHREEQKKFAGRERKRAPPLKKNSEDQQQQLHRRPKVESERGGKQSVKRKQRSPVTTTETKESRQMKVDPAQPNS
jgi:hypothetical protein